MKKWFLKLITHLKVECVKNIRAFNVIVNVSCIRIITKNSTLLKGRM